MGPLMIALAALMLQLGAKEDEVDDVFAALQPHPLPSTPGDAIYQVKKAIEEVQS